MADSSLTWEWVALSGERILARLDPTEGMESIYVGPRLVSRARIGMKPEGHPIPAKPGAPSASTLVVTYDPARGAFDLRANGQVVAPVGRPPSVPPASLGAPASFAASRARPMPLPPPPVTGSSGFLRFVIGGVVASAVAASVFGGVRAVRKQTAPPAGIVDTKNGLVRLHYPEGFLVQKSEGEAVSGAPPPTLPRGTRAPPPPQSSWVSIGHFQRDEGVFMIALRTNGVSVGRDPWVVSNYLHKKFVEGIQQKLFKEQATVTETNREELTCLGETGAVVTATFTAGADTGTFWTCTFLHDGDAFMMGYFVNKKAAEDEPAVRAILFASELLPKQ